MNQTVKAVYENGVFRLLESVDLEEGEEVKITVKMDDVESTDGKIKTDQINNSVSPKSKP